MTKTYREQFNEAMACNTREEAQQWLSREITRYKTDFGTYGTEARAIILHNLGYYTGYHDEKVAKKIRDLFGAVHPIFGDLSDGPTMTPEETLKAGMKLAENMDRLKWKRNKGSAWIAIQQKR